MTTTAIERHAGNGSGVTLFPGTTAAEIIGVAADVAAQFSDVVKRQKMFQRIGSNEHVLIEAWQTIGALTGVVADDGTVTELAWPAIEPLSEDEPPLPQGSEPRDRTTPEWRAWNEADKTRRAWEGHRDMLRARALGRSFGFKAEFRAAKNGQPVGWGEGRCTRGETSKVNQDDYALASMAQTRAQSRALGAPLKFVVKLAGYETTPAEELDGNTPAAAAGGEDPAQARRIEQLEAELAAANEQLAKQGAPWGPVTDNNEDLEQAAQIVQRLVPQATGEDAARFVTEMGNQFDGIPQACMKMLRALLRQDLWIVPPENAPAAQGSGYRRQPTPDQVYPPGSRRD